MRCTRVTRINSSYAIFLGLDRPTIHHFAGSYSPSFSDGKHILCLRDREQGKVPLYEGSERHWEEENEVELEC